MERPKPALTQINSPTCYSSTKPTVAARRHLAMFLTSDRVCMPTIVTRIHVDNYTLRLAIGTTAFRGDTGLAKLISTGYVHMYNDKTTRRC